MSIIGLYLILFLDGILSFISPCFLPLIPIYLSFLGASSDNKKNKIIINAIFFILGFTSIFILMGIAATGLSRFILEYSNYFYVIGGIVIIILGLNFSGIINISFLNRTLKPKISVEKKGNIISSFFIGVIFSIGWTPCIGTFLGSALIKASASKTVIEGVLLLTCYSLGLGIPFLLSAIFLNELQNTFTFIKKNYKIINLVSGIFLIIIGLLMVTGLFQKFMYMVA